MSKQSIPRFVSPPPRLLLYYLHPSNPSPPPILFLGIFCLLIFFPILKNRVPLNLVTDWEGGGGYVIFASHIIPYMDFFSLLKHLVGGEGGVHIELIISHNTACLNTTLPVFDASCDVDYLHKYGNFHATLMAHLPPRGNILRLPSQCSRYPSRPP